LARTADGVRISLRGMGCMDWCTNAPWADLAGDYHPRPRASFACPEKTLGLKWDEENICLDPELAALDRELAAAFAKAEAAATSPARTALIKTQRTWLATRGEDCRNSNAGGPRTCLVEAYRKRLAELR